jgi:hypothetical protein
LKELDTQAMTIYIFTTIKLCRQYQVPTLHVPTAFFCVDKIKGKGESRNCQQLLVALTALKYAKSHHHLPLKHHIVLH